MLLDDLLRLHERAGAAMMVMTGTWDVYGLTSKNLGELLFWFLIAVPLGLWLLSAHVSSDASGRRHSYALLGCAVFLAAFAVGADMLHGLLESELGSAGQVFLELVETAGELVAMSLVLVVAVALASMVVDRESPTMATEVQ